MEKAKESDIIFSGLQFQRSGDETSKNLKLTRPHKLCSIKVNQLQCRRQNCQSIIYDMTFDYHLQIDEI